MDNSVNVLLLADMHNAAQLKSKSMEFIVKNAHQVMATEGWSQIIKANRVELLAIQEEYPKFMRGNGFSLNRGEQGSDREHVDTLTLKKQTLVKEVKALEEKGI